MKHCYECHGGKPESIQGGLRLDEPAAMLKGGETGPIIRPGDVESSSLISALRYEQLKMPPEGRLAFCIVFLSCFLSDPYTLAVYISKRKAAKS
ncbi:hypothetical protein OAE21_00725 [Rubripirellula sp.]|nr:hypothetical protein [Rubripirellula sp.]